MDRLQTGAYAIPANAAYSGVDDAQQPRVLGFEPANSPETGDIESQMGGWFWAQGKSRGIRN